MIIDCASAVPVSFDGPPRGFVLESGLSSISIENTKLGLVHGIGGRLSLNPGPYSVKLFCECCFCRWIQCIGFTLLRSLQNGSDIRFAAA